MQRNIIKIRKSDNAAREVAQMASEFVKQGVVFTVVEDKTAADGEFWAIELTGGF